MIARGASSTNVSNQAMTTKIAKNPESANPAMRRAASVVNAGCVHGSVPAATNSPATTAKGVRPASEGNDLNHAMLPRQAASPGNIEVEAACTALGAPNAAENSRMTAHEQVQA